MKYIRIRSLQQYLIRTMSISRAFSVFSDSDAEYPDAEFARARRYLLGKVGRVESSGVYVCICKVPYLTLSKGEVIYYMHLHASS